MQLSEETIAKYGGTGVAAVIAWLLASWRNGRVVGRYEERFKAVTKKTDDLEVEVEALKKEDRKLREKIDGIDCLSPGDCLSRQAAFEKILSDRHLLFEKMLNAQFLAGVREFDEIKRMIKDQAEASEKRQEASENRYNQLVAQLISERPQQHRGERGGVGSRRGSPKKRKLSPAL